MGRNKISSLSGNLGLDQFLKKMIFYMVCSQVQHSVSKIMIFCFPSDKRVQIIHVKNHCARAEANEGCSFNVIMEQTIWRTKNSPLA